MKLLIFLFGIVLAINCTKVEHETHYIRLHKNPQTVNCIILTEEKLSKFRGYKNDQDIQEIVINSKLAQEPMADSKLFLQDQSQIIEIFSRDQLAVSQYTDSICKTLEKVLPMSAKQMEIFAPEVRKLVDGGNQGNRIDVVFMGDGYTADEKEQFFSDMQRLITEMFEGPTFKSYLPVFNIWAIYVESNESGIGYNGAKDTPFRLYRSQGQLRGIFTGNAAFARQTCQLTGASGCDYPSLIGNDDFYGGLGGEFVISTKSERTGTVVLRHEMGHNFINVGEEYDDGGVYRGVNTASSLNTVGWTHWLTEPVREERMIYRLLDYPWVDLSEGPETMLFTSDGNYNRWYCQASVSAAGEADSLEFILDGEILPWSSSGFDDREFYDWFGTEGFTAGSHNLTVRAKTPSTHPTVDRMLCSVSCHEYGDETEFVQDNLHVSAYPTWDGSRRKTYRPTNEGCLMRNMTHDSFCTICQEGMWYQFFQRISIIDEVEILALNPDGSADVRVNTLKLGQLRPEENQIDGETLEIQWFHQNIEQELLNGQFDITAAVGSWRVEVKFVTPEVRHDPTNLLTDTANFSV